LSEAYLTACHGGKRSQAPHLRINSLSYIGQNYYMPSCLYEYKALVNAYKCEITEKSHFLFVNGYKK